MRYVEGGDLRTLLRRGQLPSERAVAIAAALASALDAAHQQGLVHRDVKPSNVLLDQRGHCYLADFGLTQSALHRSRPSDGRLSGSVDYISPEQIRGVAVDGRSDGYSLSCLLLDMLTGDVPFRRTTEVATLFAHLEQRPPAVHDRRAGRVAGRIRRRQIQQFPRRPDCRVKIGWPDRLGDLRQPERKRWDPGFS